MLHGSLYGPECFTSIYISHSRKQKAFAPNCYTSLVIMSGCLENTKESNDGDGESWKKRHMTEISSIAIFLFLYFQARIAHWISLLAAFALSGVDETICTASSLEITSHT